MSEGAANKDEPSPQVSTMDENRREFLLRMYDQMFNDINTHIMVVWQSVGVLVASFAVLALTEKQIVSIDIATAIVLLVVSWLIAHLYDASYWYNRNLVIIANIERQFLKQADLRLIHYYFGAHRKTGSMLLHLRIQYCLGVGVGILFLAFHFLTRVWPDLGSPGSQFDPQRALPYLVLIASAAFLLWLRDDRARSYHSFITNSPGASVDSTGIVFGKGHPTENSSGQNEGG